ncbi:MAG: shikimate kinase [Dysgonomonas sp.]
MKRIFLIGYMGTGKTTAGRELAKSMGLEFVDLDHFIQARYQKTVSQLFDEVGEAEFRNIEQSILAEVGDFENVVVSTGGGTPCFFNNMEYMNQVGTTIYLKASPEALTARLNTPSCKEKRPLIKDKTEEELYAFIVESLSKREPYYSKAQIIFETEELISREDVDRYIQQLISKL